MSWFFVLHVACDECGLETESEWDGTKMPTIVEERGRLRLGGWRVNLKPTAGRPTLYDGTRDLCADCAPRYQ